MNAKYNRRAFKRIAVPREVCEQLVACVGGYQGFLEDAILNALPPIAKPAPVGAFKYHLLERPVRDQFADCVALDRRSWWKAEQALLALGRAGWRMRNAARS